MIAACRICGELVTGRSVSVPLVEFAITEKDAETQRQLQEFDFLGQAFVQHIGMRHPKQATELAAVSNLSMKAFAMRQAQSSDEHFDVLHGAWRDTIRLAIFEAQAAEARPSPAGSSLSSSPLPSGS